MTKHRHEFDLVGGHVSLDFVNTLSGSRDGERKERLTSYDALLDWSIQVGVTSGRRAAVLRRTARDRADEAGAVVDRAIALREALFRIVSAAADHRRPPPSDVDLLNDELSLAAPHARLRPRGADFCWELRTTEDDLDQVLWSIVRAAADLLTSEQVERVVECGSDGCSWLFLDTSRNRRRRWCDMASCGNRAKARRHRARRRADPSDPGGS